jgi:hypothetical protein
MRRDPRFREALLKEGIQCLLAEDMDMGKAILRNYIKATMSSAELGNLIEKSAKSLMHMFGPKGNPQARNLFEVIDQLQKREGRRLKVHTVRRSRNRHRSPHRLQKPAPHAA